MSELLFNEILEKVETYTYRINGGGKYHVQETGSIVIVFKNDKFASAEFDIPSPYSRNGWRILAAIERKIEELESLREESP